VRIPSLSSRFVNLIHIKIFLEEVLIHVNFMVSESKNGNKIKFYRNGLLATLSENF